MHEDLSEADVLVQAALDSLKLLRPVLQAMMRRDFPALGCGALDDVWQEVMIAVWQNAQSLSELDVVMARRWICAVARHRAIDSCRRQSAQFAAEAAYAAEHVKDSISRMPVSLGIEEAQLPDWLNREIEKLPSQKRQFVELRYWTGLSLGDIGRILGADPLNLAAMSSRMMRTLKAAAPGDVQCLPHFDASNQPSADEADGAERQ